MNASPSEKVFEAAFAKTLKFEGCYVDDPADPGGETKFGISKRAYPDLDIEALSEGDAGEIYRRDYWTRCRYGEIQNAAIAIEIFDVAVVCGPRRANMMLQEAARRANGHHLEVDGILGDRTLGEINKCESPAHLLAELRLQEVEYFLRLNRPKYLAGWIRRALA